MKDHHLIIGGAGFIGSNLASHYLQHDKRVTIFDNFSRFGSSRNVEWLQRHGGRLTILSGDIRNPDDRFFDAIEEAEVVYHLAGQVAVTTSVANPREDFENNVLGTLNVLEAVRVSRSRPVVLYSSTNKVYGKMDDVEVSECADTYAYVRHVHGIPETQGLDFYSPYGCSKGAGDQYVRDYARIYDLKTIVFRQSCIYGPRQFGCEDQGWVAWFGIQAINGRPVTVFGDGKQVRDILYVEDLIEAYDAAVESASTTSGQVYNIGGGPQKTLSLLQLIDLLEECMGFRVSYSFDEWRSGDQRIFVSDTRKARADFGWEPRTNPADGVGRLVDWLRREAASFAKHPSIYVE